jgi:ATP-binding cassette subfamily B multidrug efflux pump
LRNLFRFNHYFRKYASTVVWGVLFLTASNLFLVWIPVLIRQTMDLIGARPDSLSQDLTRMSMGLTLAAVGYGILLFATRQTLIVTSRRIEFDLRNDLFNHVLKLPQTWITTYTTGDLYVRLTEDVGRVREYFGPAFMYGVNTVTRSGIIIAVMFWVSPKLTVWALVPLPILSVLAYWMSKYIHDRSHEIQEQYATLAGHAQETFSGIRLIKAYVRESHRTSVFQAESERYRRRKLRLDVVESLFHPMLALLIGSSVVLVVWQGGLLVTQGMLTVGNIAEFIIYVTYLTWPIASLGYTLNLVQRAAASQMRIQSVLDAPTLETPDDATVLETPIRGDIEFRNVSFTYPGSDYPAVRGLNLSIPAGSHVGLIGRTGSGKSTILHLLTRVWSPDSGQILLDGRPIESYPLDRLRAQFSLVPQDGFLFSDTIRENIRFGAATATDHDVEDAAANARILENILEFDRKFETILGERGITLSGGQKQRTAIARAIIRNPKVLLLDDALCAVDTQTEDAILTALEQNDSQRTTITISHRLSSLRHARKIHVLDDGQIIESGTHDELMTIDGRYAAMFRKQLLEQELDQIA